MLTPSNRTVMDDAILGKRRVTEQDGLIKNIEKAGELYKNAVEIAYECLHLLKRCTVEGGCTWRQVTKDH